MGNRRTFHQHCLLRLVLPGLPWFSLIVLIPAAVLYLLPYSQHVRWLLVLIVLPLLKLFYHYLEWQRFSVIASAGSGFLIVQLGILNIRQHMIPLTPFTTVTYERPWWASLLSLDVADVIIGAMGGPHVLPSMGDFGDLWIVLQSRGQIVPAQRPSALVRLLRLISRGVSLLLSSLISLGRSALDMTVTGLRDWATSSFGHLHQTLRRREPLKDFGFIADTPLGPLSAAMERLQQPTAHQDILDGGHIYQGMPFAAQTPSYVGFCAFCEQFIIGDKNWTRWHYRTRDPSRRYYPDGISDHVAQYYLDCLREASIIIPGPNGCCGERLSCRIRSVGDIQRLIPEYSLSSCAN